MHGGSGRWLWEVYSRLNPEDYLVIAGETDGDRNFDQKAKLTINRVKFEYKNWSDWTPFTLGGIIFYTKLFLQIRKYIKRESVNAIHCGRCIPEGFIALLCKKLYGTKYYCYIHGEDIENSATSRSLAWVVKPVLAKADLLICNSQNSYRLLFANWDVKKESVVVVNPGADTSIYKPGVRSAEKRKALGWEDRFVLLTVSRLEERKGHDMLIRALPAIKEVIPDILYAIVGSGPRESFLKQLSTELNVEDNVCFMTNVTDEGMIDCYQQADIFVLPNRDIGRNIEGFGIVMIEAQACGLPVIGGNSGGTPETIKDGITGIIVDCNTPRKLEESIIYLFRDKQKAKTLSISAREHSIEYDWNVKSQEIGAIIAERSAKFREK